MSELPKGLPGLPGGLPEADPTATVEGKPAIETSRTCSDCKTNKHVRIVSNQNGVRAWCRKCKNNWGISSNPMAPPQTLIPPRGLSKQTLVEPDWNMANEDISGDTTHEQVGPKKR